LLKILFREASRARFCTACTQADCARWMLLPAPAGAREAPECLLCGTRMFLAQHGAEAWTVLRPGVLPPP
jgi:hypothetical protein